MTHRPLFFLTNDDGIGSPGLRAAVRAVRDLGEVLVVAPATQQTAMGRSFTGRPDAALEAVPFEVDGAAVRAYACEGSPASVVRHGLHLLCGDRRPDLLVSGINYGENVGISIGASGTVGAAMEAAARGIPALAASQQMHPDHFMRHESRDWGAAEHFLRLFARKLLGARLPKDVDLLKLDVPEGATSETPWRLSRLSRQRYFELAFEDPGLHSRLKDGRVTVQVDHDALEPDSDVHALVRDRVVALTPLSLDATSRADFADIHRALEG
ncbi:5'/3'-nucleotidase SurE [Geothrix alkalitolerans]|uniref:5'/3'-nucleotidase SurE n=1 Tax=Geothrix alkalitolerans TaxID=2922724 RepID=UPI001FAF72A4|nr:5'/3'-nucleotidase SurE [Geothrix alkalitolerans]